MPQTGVPTSSVAQGNEDEVQPTRLNMNEKVVAAFSRIEPEFLGFNSDAWDEAESLALEWDLVLPSSEATYWFCSTITIVTSRQTDSDKNN